MGGKSFDKLLKEGITSIVVRRGSKRAQVETEIAREFGCSVHAVISWQRRAPKRLNYRLRKRAESLAQYCHKEGHVDNEWIQRLLERGGYRDKEAYETANQICSTTQFSLPGRDIDIRRLLKGFAETDIKIVWLEGEPGVGKTLLVKEFVRLFNSDTEPEALFKRTVWLKKEKYTRQEKRKQKWAVLESVLDEIARQLEEPSPASPGAVESKNQVIKKLLNQTNLPTLLVLDDFEKVEYDPELMEWLLNDVPEQNSILVITKSLGHGIELRRKSRRILAVRLEGLETSDAIMFIRREAHMLTQEERRLQEIETAEDEKLAQLAQAVKCIPMLILMALGHIASGMSIDELIECLKKKAKAERPEVANTNLTEVADIYNYSYDEYWLKLSPKARRLLMAATFFRAPATLEALHKVAGLQPIGSNYIISELTRGGLVRRVVGVRARYDLHDMTFNFVRDKLDALKSKADLEWRREARKRWVEWYVTLAEQAYDFRNYPKLREEAQNLLAVAESLSHGGDEDIITLVALLRSVERFFYAESYWDDLLTLSGSVRNWVKHTRTEQALSALADIFQTYVSICIQLDDQTHGKEWLEEAEIIKANATLDKPEILERLKAEILLGRGRLLEYADYSLESVIPPHPSIDRKSDLDTARALFEGLNLWHKVMWSDNSLGKFYLLNGQFDEAESCFKKALEICEVREVEIPRAARWKAALEGNLAHVIGGKGDELWDTGFDEEAVSNWRQALKTLCDIEGVLTDWEDKAEARAAQAYYKLRLGDAQGAWQLRAQAEEIRDKLKLCHYLCLEDKKWQSLV